MKTISSQKKRSRLIKKADRELQEAGRRIYKHCLVCNKPMSCLHHYHCKSQSNALRYDWDNCIPLCVSCHFRHHNGDPNIQNMINRIKGQDWVDNLEAKRKRALKEGFKPTIKWLEDKIEVLKNI